MGLYDNYKATYSQQVPTFAGSIVPELKAAKDQADEKYELAQEGMINLGEMKNQAPTTPQDQDNWKKINTEAEAKLAEWSSRPDLENAVIDIHRYSKQVGNKLKTLALQKKARDEYRTDVDKFEGIDQRTREYYKNSADDAYAGGLQLDENGRPLNSYGGKAPVKSVDAAEKIQKALKIIFPHEEILSQEYDTKGGWYTVKTKDEVKQVSVEQVVNAMRQAKAMDYEWQASDQQEHDVQLYNNTKNVTDGMVMDYLQSEANSSDPNTIIRTKEIKDLVAKGTPAAEAFKTVESRRISNTISNTEEAYASGAAFKNTTTERSQKDGPAMNQQWELDTHAKKAAIDQAVTTAKENAANWTVLGGTINVEDWAKTGEELNKTVAQFDEISNSLSSRIEQNKSIANNKDAPLESQLRAQAEITADEKALEANKYRQSYIRDAQTAMLEKAAEAEYGKPWVTIKAEAEVATHNAFKAELKRLYPEGIKATNGSTVTVEELETALKNKTARQGEGLALKLPDGRVIKDSKHARGIDGTAGNSIVTNYFSSQKKGIEKRSKVEKRAAGMATTGMAIQTTQVPIRDEKDIKALKQVARSIKLYDVSGSKVMDLSDEDIDWSKVEIGTYIPELKMVNMQVSNGTETFQVLGDLSSAGFHNKVGSELSLSSDPYIREMGQAIKSDNFQVYRQKFDQASGIITTMPNKNPDVYEPITAKGRNYGVLRNNNGTFSLIDLATKQIEKTSGNKPHSDWSIHELTVFLDKIRKN